MSLDTKKPNPKRLPVWQQIVVGLIIAGVIAAYVGGRDAAQPTNAADTSSLPRPDQQLRFCEIIDAGAAAYKPTRASWDSEKNPIARERLTPKLAAMRNERDAAILAQLGGPIPEAEGWVIRIIEMSLDMGRKNRMTLDMSARCRAMTTLSATFDMTEAQADALAKIKVGDYATISGNFFGHDVSQNSAARALNWDGFEGDAMLTPSYRLNLTSITVP